MIIPNSVHIISVGTMSHWCEQAAKQLLSWVPNTLDMFGAGPTWDGLFKSQFYYHQAAQLWTYRLWSEHEPREWGFYYELDRFNRWLVDPKQRANICEFKHYLRNVTECKIMTQWQIPVLLEIRFQPAEIGRVPNTPDLDHTESLIHAYLRLTNNAEILQSLLGTEPRARERAIELDDHQNGS